MYFYAAVVNTYARKSFKGSDFSVENVGLFQAALCNLLRATKVASFREPKSCTPLYDRLPGESNPQIIGPVDDPNFERVR